MSVQIKTSRQVKAAIRNNRSIAYYDEVPNWGYRWVFVSDKGMETTYWWNPDWSGGETSDQPWDANELQAAIENLIHHNYHVVVWED